MIQRIQSVYLLLASILLVITLLIPLVTIANESATYSYRALGIYNNIGIQLTTWGVICIGALSALLPCIAIFTYKNRKRQIKIAYSSILMILLFYITFGAYLASAIERFSVEVNSFGIGLALPTIAMIFISLAIKKIKSDEKLVRSLDRLR